MKKTVILAATLIVAALLAVVLWPKNQPAPAFTLPDLNGRTVSIVDL